jgi:hypothetical protein
MQALVKQYAIEDSVDFKKSHPMDTEWLQEYHGYWIQSECAPFLCKKLCIQLHEQAYYQDIQVWFPDVEGGVSCMPVCLTYKSNMNVRPHSYPNASPGLTSHDIQLSLLCHVKALPMQVLPGRASK